MARYITKLIIVLLLYGSATTFAPLNYKPFIKWIPMAWSVEENSFVKCKESPAGTMTIKAKDEGDFKILIFPDGQIIKLPKARR